MRLLQQPFIAQHDFAYATLLPRDADAAINVAAQARLIANAFTLLISCLSCGELQK
jgi:hypothetical protein